MSGLADSPLGLATWMLDHDASSEEQLSRAIVEGRPYGAITRDDVIDNLTLYWLTNTGVSPARPYWENKFSFFGVKGISIPVAVSVFPGERYQAPRSWAERAYKELVYFNELDAGGHFAAWEQPKLLSEEVRPGFRCFARGSWSKQARGVQSLGLPPKACPSRSSSGHPEIATRSQDPRPDTSGFQVPREILCRRDRPALVRTSMSSQHLPPHLVVLEDQAVRSTELRGPKKRRRRPV
jgi:hypothetical protein